MKTELVKWELELLLTNRRELILGGRDTGYSEDKRIESLRAHLDSEKDETKTEGETVPTVPAKATDEIPF